MSDDRRRETGSEKVIPKEVKLAKRRSRLNHTARLIELAGDKLRELGEDAPPDLVDLLPEAQRKVDDAKKYGTDYHLHRATSFTDTLLRDPFLTGLEVIAGRRKGARISGRGDKKRQAKYEAMREWLDHNKERERGWKARFNRAMKKKWGIKKTDAARKFIDRHINKLND